MISVRSLSKTFRIPEEAYSRVKDKVMHPLRRTPYRELVSLDGVGFEVATGEFFGVVGRNGSGKTTLMRCLAGIYQPDAGNVTIRGRIAPFIELGVGFNPEMTARENAFVNAVMLGLQPRDARERLDPIFEFSELEGFAEMRLKNYSSGMVMRLAFAVTVQVDADVLLFDEVLSVGDAAFQDKCVQRLGQLKAEGRTVVLVTHEMRSVERFCDRALILDGGRVMEIGDPGAVAARYHRVNAERRRRESPSERSGDAVAILDGWFEDAGGRRTTALPQREVAYACIEVCARRPVSAPEFLLSLRQPDTRPVFQASSGWSVRLGDLTAGARMIVRMRFENWLGAGTYHLSAAVLDSAGQWLAGAERIGMATVYGPRVTGSMTDLPHAFEVVAR